jgi:hypothetical protein
MNLKPELLSYFPDYPDLTLPPDRFPALTPQELVRSWQATQGGPGDRIVPTSDILGVVALPDRPSTSILSVDLCEVVRETHYATALAVGLDRSYIANDIWLYRASGLDHAQVPFLVTVLMNRGEVSPIQDIGEVAQIIRSLKEEQPDLLVVANTSTLPGCEVVTLEFLAEHLPGCFDGILFPRNHFGDAAVTKADAIAQLLKTVNGGQACERLVHIDDAPHHAGAIINAMSRLAFQGCCIMPTYARGDNSHTDTVAPLPEGAVLATSPVEAFSLAREYLATHDAGEAV